METFIHQYIHRGFGSMTKNDFEVFLFGQILLMTEYKGKSNYELSILLRIPESKVKRLRYESALRNSDPTINYRTVVYNLLDKAQLRAEDKKIVFQVEDIMIKSYISSILKKEGRMLDSSFNSELVVLRLSDFQYLAQEVYPKGEVDNVLQKAADLSKHSQDKPITWNEVLGWIVQGAISGGVSTITANLTPIGIISSLTNYFKK